MSPIDIDDQKMRTAIHDKKEQAVCSESVDEDPRSFTLRTWIAQALRLSPRELAARSFSLIASTTRNLILLPKLIRRSKHAGRRLRIIVLTERLGDIIAAEPTARALRENGDDVAWMVRPRFADLLKFNPGIDYVVPVSSYIETAALRYLFRGCTWNVLHIHNTLCSTFGLKTKNENPLNLGIDNYYNFGCLADVFSLIGVGRLATETPRLFPDPSFDVTSFLRNALAEPNRPLLVIHTTSDEAARSWDPDKARRLAETVIRDTSFNIIELGLAPVLPPSDRVFQLRDTIPLTSQFGLVARADRFVGVDSGFAHVANAAGVDSLFLLGAFHTFKSHLPWRLKPSDRVIRAKQQCRTIKVEDVFAWVAAKA